MSVINVDTSEVIEEQPSDLSPNDIAPKRRKGRQAYPRDAQGRIIRPDGSIGTRSVSTPRSRVNLEEQITGFLTLGNMIVMAYKSDFALDPVEIAALTKAINQQAQVSPKFRKYLEKFLGGAGSINLVVVVGAIVARRVVRVTPMPAESPVTGQQIDDMLGAIIYASVGKPMATMQVS